MSLFASVAAQMRRMEQTGVIEGCHARIRPAAVGLPLTALVQRIGKHADANSHIVIETPLEHRALQIPPPASAATVPRNQ